MKKYATIALSSGDHKMACLFWDFIVPFHSYDDVPKELRLPLHLPDDKFDKFVKESYSPNRFDQFQNEWVHSTYNYLLKQGKPISISAAYQQHISSISEHISISGSSLAA